MFPSDAREYAYSDPTLISDHAEPHPIRHAIRVTVTAGEGVVRCPPVIRPGLLCIKFDTVRDDKEIRWIGTSYDDLLGFPDDVRREAG